MTNHRRVAGKKRGNRCTTETERPGEARTGAKDSGSPPSPVSRIYFLIARREFRCRVSSHGNASFFLFLLQYIYKALPTATCAKRIVYIYIYMYIQFNNAFLIFFFIFNRTVGDKRSIKRLKIVKMLKNADKRMEI